MKHWKESDVPDWPSDATLDVFMGEALAEAEAAGHAGEWPIGEVLMIDGAIASRGRARHRQLQSQLAHAELHALLAGGEALWDRFEQALLVTTCEPCPMCLGASVMADAPPGVFAMPDAMVHSAQTVETNPYERRHLRIYRGGVLEAKARALMARFDPGWLDYVATRRSN